MTRLLVSVRDAAEAEAAVQGGAALIDVKEPTRGSLGRADDEVLASVVRQVRGRQPVSAALGELVESAPPPGTPGLSFAKWGLAGAARLADWRECLLRAAARLATTAAGCEPVAVAYADWQRAAAPAPGEVADFAWARRWPVLLVDTWCKDGTTLLDWLTPVELGDLGRECRAAGVRLALAGSLGLTQLAALRDLGPDWFAVRGAACRDGCRTDVIDAARVRGLAEWLERSAAGCTGL